MRPVGLSRDLPSGRVMRAQADGRDMVVWRAHTGQIAAWDNRCPHRGMRLSHGFVRGNALACLYHGWHYGAGGQCSYIPAHPDLEPPATIQATVYAATEAQGVIWVAAEGAAQAGDLPQDMAPLRSMIATCDEARLWAACLATPLAGTLPERKGDILDFEGLRVTILCNPIAPDQTQITILADGDANAARALLHWSEAMRRRAEIQP